MPSRRSSEAGLEPEAWAIGRRELLGLVGLFGLAIAGCGTSSGSPVRASSSEPTTDAASATSLAPASSGVTAPASSSPAVAPVARIGGPHVKAGAMSVSDARREAKVANGIWRGGWHDTAGNSGTSDVTIAIDGSARTARATVAFAGPLLGASVPPQVYDVDLRSFVLLADMWTVDSPQFGTVTIVPDGYRYGSGSAKDIPGHPEIASITVQAMKIGRRVDIAYTVKHTAGTIVKGTMAWSALGGRATPKPLHKTA